MVSRAIKKESRFDALRFMLQDYVGRTGMQTPSDGSSDETAGDNSPLEDVDALQKRARDERKLVQVLFFELRAMVKTASLIRV